MLVLHVSWHQREHGRRIWSGLRSRPRGADWHSAVGRRVHLRTLRIVLALLSRIVGVVLPVLVLQGK